MGGRIIPTIIIFTTLTLSLLNTAIPVTQVESHADELPNTVTSNSQVPYATVDPVISQEVEVERNSSMKPEGFISSETHSPGRDSYIIDFGFVESYTYSTSLTAINSFGAYLGVDVSASFEVGFTIPVNITLVYTPSVEGGKSVQVVSTLYKSTDTSFYVNYGFNMDVNYKLPFQALRTFSLVNYQNTYQIFSFETPFDEIPLTEKSISLNPAIALIPGIGPAMASLFSVDLTLIPQLDLDLSTSVYYSDDGSVDPISLNFRTFQDQVFAVSPHLFSPDMTDVEFGLSDLSLDPYISILWRLDFGFGDALSLFNQLIGNQKIELNLLTYPRFRLPISLTTSQNTSGFLDIIANRELPDYTVSTYFINDSTGNANTYPEPGESFVLDLEILNTGTGYGLRNNISLVASDIGGTTGFYQFTEYLSPDDVSIVSFPLNVPVDYTNSSVNLQFVIEGYSINGTYVNRTLDLQLKVILPGTAIMYLKGRTVVEPTNGVFDAGDIIRIDFELQKAGTVTVNYTSVQIVDTNVPGITSNSTFFSTSAPSLTNVTTNNIFIAAASNSTFKSMKLLVLISTLTQNGMSQEYWVVTLSVRPLAAIEVVNAVYYTDLVTPNNEFNAGDLIEFQVELLNVGTFSSGTVIGAMTSNSSDLSFQEPLMVWYDHVPGSAGLASPYLMQISEFAVNQTANITIYFAYSTWYGEIIVDSFSFLLNIVGNPSPTIGYIGYSFSPFTAGYLSTGSVDFTVSDGLGLNTIMSMTSNSPDLVIYSPSVAVGNIRTGTTYSVNDFQIYVPANFKGGLVLFTLNLTGYDVDGNQFTFIGEFTVNIAPGDLQPPLFTYYYPTSALTGEIVSVLIDYSGYSDVDTLYFILYNISTADFDVYIFDVTGSTYIELTFYMPNVNTYFAIFLTDKAGNVAYTGEYAIQILNADPVTSSSTSTPITSTPTTSTPSSTTSTSTPSSTTSTSTPSSTTSTPPNSTTIAPTTSSVTSATPTTTPSTDAGESTTSQGYAPLVTTLAMICILPIIRKRNRKL